MSTARVSTFVALLAGLVLAPAPMLAQERRGPDQDNQTQGGRRRPPRDEGARPGDNAPRADAGRSSRGGERREAVPRREVAPRADAGVNRSNGRDRDQGRRVQPNRGGRDDWRDNRGRDSQWRRGGYAPAPRAYRNYSRPTRVYTVPYGYRPRGYRPGWSLNLYFGRPFGYSYPGYYSRGGGYGYGYYAIPSGFTYGSLRIIDAPRHAQVFVDGYYAGIVDDYDGVFQRLNLEPGRHVVEIEVYAGAPPLEYDVWVEPGRTVTIHARP
jgi:hypothetical protein